MVGMMDKREFVMNMAFLAYTFCLTLLGHEMALLVKERSGCVYENLTQDIIVTLIAFAFKGYEWRQKNYEWTQSSKTHKFLDKSWMQCFNKIFIYGILMIIYVFGKSFSTDCIFENYYEVVLQLLSNLLLMCVFGITLLTYHNCCYSCCCKKADDEQSLNSNL
jgi:hypothetical protein